MGFKDDDARLRYVIRMNFIKVDKAKIALSDANHIQIFSDSVWRR